MSSKDDTSKTVFTARETELLAHAMKCTKDEVVVDYELLAEVAGFKSKDSARVAWYNMRKKLDLVSGNTAGDASSSPNKKARAESQTPKKAKSEGKKRKPANEDEAEGDLDASPVKASPTKTRKTGQATKKETTPSGDGDVAFETHTGIEGEEDNILVAAPTPKGKGNTGKKRSAAKGKSVLDTVVEDE